MASSTLPPCQSPEPKDSKISKVADMPVEHDKQKHNCLLCNGKLGATSRSVVSIFGENALTTSENFIVDVLFFILQQPIKENSHSSVICKKCLKLVNEVDELNTRLKKLKQGICDSFKKTLDRVSNVNTPNESVDHDYIENVENFETVPIVKLKNLTEMKKKENSLNISETCKDKESKVNKAVKKKKDKHCGNHVDSSDNNDNDTHNDDNEENVEDNDDVDFYNGKAGIEEVLVEEKNIKKLIKSEKKENVVELAVKLEDGYKCNKCTSDEKKDAKEIITHLKNEHDARLYICDVCGEMFTKRTNLSKHFDEHCANESGDFQCEVCNRIFNNLRLFRIHKRIHYPQIKSWSCDICGKRYSSKNLLDEHMNIHTGNRPYVCHVCNKDFTSKYTHRAHVKTHEIRPRPYTCSKCPKTFLSQQNLSQHLKTHNGIKDFVCSTCGKAFGSAHNLEVHNIVHTGYKPFICRTCGKAFARKAEIRDHERTHTGEKPYQCEFCGATFSQRSNLQSHKRATHYNDKRYKCDDCGKGFKRRRLLDYHIKAAHTGERPYKCPTCSATFVYPEHFKKHMRIHTGEKPFLCEVCGKAFNSRDNRNAHRFIHSDKKPYECLICGAGFMRKPLLYAHMQSQGHLNDTIIVNQPRLTAEEEIILQDNRIHLVMQGDESQPSENAHMILAELKDNQVIVQDGYRHKILNFAGTSINRDQLNHLVIDGEMSLEEEEDEDEESSVMKCEDEEDDQNVEEVYGYQDDEGNTIILPRGTDIKQLLTQENKGLQLVQIRVPSGSNIEDRDDLQSS
ncbi:zinc finger protein 436 [Copidosoma floridanum]|uniref:zinc finger protein 436 n=1 Tax=Copidosoma floridanum TaxID=29053 RepID=UPI0006C984BE|nr:zinc finger protein 436 [Copidosoma floridanum]